MADSKGLARVCVLSAWAQHPWGGMDVVGTTWLWWGSPEEHLPGHPLICPPGKRHISSGATFDAHLHSFPAMVE